MSKDEDTLKEIAMLQEELEIIESQNKLATHKCIYCGEINSDVIILISRKPAHGACHEKNKTEN